MQGLNNKINELLGAGQGPADLAEAEAAAANASIGVLGYNQDHLVEEVVSEVRLRLIQRCKAGNPPYNPPSWAWKLAHAYAQNMSQIESCNTMATSEPIPFILKELVGKENVVSRILELVDIAASAFAHDPENRCLYDLYYRKKYNLERVAAVLDAGIIATKRRWHGLMKKISYAVRMMFYEDPQLNVMFAPIINDRRRFHHFFIHLLGLITHDEMVGSTK